MFTTAIADPTGFLPTIDGKDPRNSLLTAINMAKEALRGDPNNSQAKLSLSLAESRLRALDGK